VELFAEVGDRCGSELESVFNSSNKVQIIYLSLFQFRDCFASIRIAVWLNLILPSRRYLAPRCGKGLT
jgi:hypothetical protein